VKFYNTIKYKLNDDNSITMLPEGQRFVKISTDNINDINKTYSVSVHSDLHYCSPLYLAVDLSGTFFIDDEEYQFVCIDFDAHGAKETSLGERITPFFIMAEMHSDLRKAVVQVTKSGGVHVYFAVPKGSFPHTRIVRLPSRIEHVTVDVLTNGIAFCDPRPGYWLDMDDKNKTTLEALLNMEPVSAEYVLEFINNVVDGEFTFDRRSNNKPPRKEKKEKESRPRKIQPIDPIGDPTALASDYPTVYSIRRSLDLFCALTGLEASTMTIYDSDEEVIKYGRGKAVQAVWREDRHPSIIVNAYVNNEQKLVHVYDFAEGSLDNLDIIMKMATGDRDIVFDGSIRHQQIISRYLKEKLNIRIRNVIDHERYKQQCQGLLEVLKPRTSGQVYEIIEFVLSDAYRQSAGGHDVMITQHYVADHIGVDPGTAYRVLELMKNLNILFEIRKKRLNYETPTSVFVLNSYFSVHNVAKIIINVLKAKTKEMRSFLRMRKAEIATACREVTLLVIKTSKNPAKVAAEVKERISRFMVSSFSVRSNFNAPRHINSLC